METILKQLDYLRAEIATRDSQLMGGVLVYGLLAVTSYIAAKASGNTSLYRLMALFVIGGVFFIGRQEYLEKRIAPWISRAEILQQSQTEKLPKDFLNWEDYLKTLKSRFLYLAPTDFLCGLPFYWMLFDGIVIQMKPRLGVSDQVFYRWSVAVLPLAIVWVFVGRWAANK